MRLACGSGIPKEGANIDERLAWARAAFDSPLMESQFSAAKKMNIVAKGEEHWQL